MKTENRLKNKIGRGRKQTAILAAGLFLYLAAAVMTAGRPAQASTVHWQDAFIMQAQSALQNAPDSSFYLIDLDGDDVLEMIINYGSVAGSEEIFTWYGDHLTSWMYEYYAFGYIPGTSQVHIGGGRQGGYYDEIYGEQMGQYLPALGFNVDLAPVADTLTDGNNQAGVDYGTELIMTGHISLPNVTGDDTPATLSRMIVTGILRERMGYEGLIITDALEMGAITQNYSSAEAAVRAVEAGNDLILAPADLDQAYRGVLDAVESGRISEERINESLRRIIRFKLMI